MTDAPRPTAESPALWPYSDEMGETYTFPLTDFPTKADCIAWFVETEGDDNEHTEDDISGPSDVLVHDHEEDYDCPGKGCPLSKTVSAWGSEW